jgi:hypothetical protein
MRVSHLVIGGTLLVFCACTPAADQRQQPKQGQTADAKPAVPPEPGTPGGLPDDRTPLAEPKGAIDPKSAEAAGQVVQLYGGLIEQQRFAEGEKLWRDPTRARRVSEELRGYSEVHLQIGRPGDLEGAAGSIYVSVPTVLYGKRKDGNPFSRSGEMTLRRVNDVPGSTAEQRTWRIETAAWSEVR